MPHDPDLRRVKAQRKSGREQFADGGRTLGIALADFWEWSVSDLLTNATRGILAEYIVASALGLSGGVREEWAAFDIQTASGIKVEVKSAAYLQSWSQKALSRISFSIRPSLAWDAESGEYSPGHGRRAHIYVFCLLAHKDKATVNPLDMSQWRFYVMNRKTLDRKVGGQRTIGLSVLARLTPFQGGYADIPTLIKKARRGR